MSNNRGLKNRTAMSSAVDTEVWSKVKAHSDETGIPISKILDKALTMYLNSASK